MTEKIILLIVWRFGIYFSHFVRDVACNENVFCFFLVRMMTSGLTDIKTTLFVKHRSCQAALEKLLEEQSDIRQHLRATNRYWVSYKRSEGAGEFLDRHFYCEVCVLSRKISISISYRPRINLQLTFQPRVVNIFRSHSFPFVQVSIKWEKSFSVFLF